MVYFDFDYVCPIILQLPEIKALGEKAFDYVFEGSEVLAEATKGLDPVKCKQNCARTHTASFLRFMLQIFVGCDSINSFMKF